MFTEVGWSGVLCAVRSPSRGEAESDGDESQQGWVCVIRLSYRLHGGHWKYVLTLKASAKCNLQLLVIILRRRDRYVFGK